MAATMSLVTLRPVVAAPARSVARRTATTMKAAGGESTLATAIKGGLVGAVDPFPEGLDPLGFSNGADEMTLKRFREAELTHGRVSMLAALGFLVGEQVEGGSFLFDSKITGPAIDHFQQVPESFWVGLLALVALFESARIQKGWAEPRINGDWFLLKDGYVPGNLEFDPLNLKPKGDKEWKDMQLKELNNGRLAMISISGMVAQELVNGLNIIPADEVLEMGKAGALKVMEAECAGSLDEAACAKAFEAAERTAVFAGNSF